MSRTLLIYCDFVQFTFQEELYRSYNCCVTCILREYFHFVPKTMSLSFIPSCWFQSYRNRYAARKGQIDCCVDRFAIFSHVNWNQWRQYGAYWNQWQQHGAYWKQVFLLASRTTCSVSTSAVSLYWCRFLYVHNRQKSKGTMYSYMFLITKFECKIEKVSWYHW